MPQLVALMIAGAGLYAGYKWVSKALGRHLEDAQRQTDALRRATEAGGTSAPKDLGQLEWDAAQRVYKPKSREGSGLSP